MALRDQPYIPLYVQDFMTDEKLSECSAESTGVYIRVMCIMHKSQEYGTILLKQKDDQNPSKIKNFAVKLHRLMPYSIDVIERSLTELVDEEVLTIEGDMLMQRRMVRDGNISLIRANAGSKGGKAAQGKSVAGSFVKAKEQAKEQANTEYEYEDEIEDEIVNSKTNKSIKQVSAIEQRFNALWEIYPKKQGRADALKAYKKAVLSGVTDDQIKQGIENYKQYIDKRGTEPQYIKQGGTFFNKQAWGDDYTVIAVDNKPKERKIVMMN